MNEVCRNHFNALCPTCGKTLQDRTYIDQKGEMFFFRTIFECESDNWALMTRIDEYNSIGPIREVKREEIMNSAFAQIKLDLTLAVIKNFIADGVRNYPLSTVEKIRKNHDTWYEKTMTSNAAAFLHVFYGQLASRYSEQGEKEKCALALETGVTYLKNMQGDELQNALIKQNRDEALDIFDRLAELEEQNGRKAAAKKTRRQKLIWQDQDCQPTKNT